MNIISRIFCYPILERELTARIADRDRQIVSQQVRIEDLENRLFMVRGVPVKGAEITTGKPAHIPTYRTGRQRLRDMVKPTVTATLTEEEEKQIEDHLTQ